MPIRYTLYCVHTEVNYSSKYNITIRIVNRLTLKPGRARRVTSAMSNISKIDLQGLGNLRSLYISNKLNKHFTLETLNIKKRVNKRFTLTLKRTVIISNLLTLTISILHTPTPKPSFLSPTVIVCGNFKRPKPQTTERPIEKKHIVSSTDNSRP